MAYSSRRVPNALTWLFLAALGAASVTRLWLAARQIRHVSSHREAVPASFAESIPLAAHQKAADYTAAKTRLGMIDVLLGVLVLLVFTLGGLIQRLSDVWSRLFTTGSIAHGTALLLSIVLAQALIGLPLAAYRTFGIEARFGFNRMTLRLFIADVVRHAIVGLILGVPLLLAVLWLMGKMGTYWWLYVWLVWITYSAALVMIYPAFIMPLFNKFTPITEGELAGRVAHLLERTGFRSRGLFLMDGSKRSSHGNAFFTGFGAAKRIVLFDTLVSRLQPPEVEAVLAHELGHYRLHHIAKQMLLSAGISLAVLAVLGLLIDRDWFYVGLGVSAPSHAAALALFMMVLPEFLFFVQPLTSRYSRRREYEADAYAVSHANAQELERALVKLYKDNAATLTPDPLHSAFYDSHPPAALRIARLAEARSA
ncbi:MAG TPA: M48 family metallopeptidase [Burkholderiales bacterium]|nr:M48 family metallopeptidase [Burkholderiales bacterium]